MQKQDEEESSIITTFLAENIKAITHLKHQSHCHLQHCSKHQAYSLKAWESMLTWEKCVHNWEVKVQIVVCTHKKASGTWLSPA